MTDGAQRLVERAPAAEMFDVGGALELSCAR